MLPAHTCPWDKFDKATITFCEEPLCAWVVKPAETWSNIGFVIVGLYVWHLAKKEDFPHLKPFGYTGILLGIFSGVFHATGTFFGEFLDVSSMYLFTCLGIAYNSQRLFTLSFKKVQLIFFGLLFLSMGLMLIYRPIGIPVFGAQFIAAVLLEATLFFKAKKGVIPMPDYRNFIYMAITFLVSWAVWWLDLLKILCDPDNHIFTGHAFWHLGCSLTFYFVYRFFTQFGKIDMSENNSQ